MTLEEEKKNRRVGMLVSLGLHGAVLLLFIFLVAWREPNPPLPEYGIELNFGTDQVGTGDVQPLTPATNTENLEEAQPEEATTTDPVDEAEQEESSSEAEIQDVSEVDEASQQESQEVTYEDPLSEDIVEEITEETVTDKEQEETELASEESKAVDAIEEEQVETGAQGEEGQEETPQEVNQGDKEEEVGDQGSETGNIDDRALYGKPGGEGGSSLELAGWTWDFAPDPKDTSSESGRIVFEIKIDDQGDIITIRTIERTVSPSVEAIYKREVERITFSKTDNLPPAPVSTGRITFIIKAK